MATEQQLPTAGKTSVTDSLIGWLSARPETERLVALLRERQKKGIETYGRSLETFNGRDVHRDLREELVDALQYEEQRRLEHAALLSRLRVALAALRAAEDVHQLVGAGPEHEELVHEAHALESRLRRKALSGEPADWTMDTGGRE
jgi:hypothetical protein